MQSEAMKEKKPAVPHETHAQFENMQRSNPHELSRLKSEKDLVLLQRREAERRQQLVRNTARFE